MEKLTVRFVFAAFLSLLALPQASAQKVKFDEKANEILAANMGAALVSEKLRTQQLDSAMTRKQKVALAKSMAAESEIIIFDEPTRGIDVATKYDIYVLMNELVAQGKAILMVSSEMPELIGMCDRIVVLSERHQAAIVEKDQFSQEYILDLASGSN